MGFMDKIFGRPPQSEKLRDEKGVSTPFQETKPSAHAMKSVPEQSTQLSDQKGGVVRPADVARSRSLGTVRDNTPLSKESVAVNRIDAKTLEHNLQSPVFDDPLLPNLPKAKRDEPYLYGADHVLPPKTGYADSKISEGGLHDLRTNPTSVELALQNPGSTGTANGEFGDDYRRRRSAARLAPRSKVAAGISSQDLRALQGVELVQSDPDEDWRQAVAAARKGNISQSLTFDERWKVAREEGKNSSDVGSGDVANRIETFEEADKRLRAIPKGESLDKVYNGRPPAMPSNDERWEAARQAAQRTDEFVAQQRALALMSKEETLSSGGKDEKQARRKELRDEMLQKILELKAMMLAEQDADTRELMQEVLERSIARYSENYLRKF